MGRNCKLTVQKKNHNESNKHKQQPISSPPMFTKKKDPNQPPSPRVEYQQQKQSQTQDAEPSELTQQKAKIAKSILQEKYMNQKLVRQAQEREQRYISYDCIYELFN
jgi:hypothetical protein